MEHLKAGRTRLSCSHYLLTYLTTYLLTSYVLTYLRAGRTRLSCSQPA